MSESEDQMLLRFEGGNEFMMTRHNAKLFTFFGNLATRNHIFVATGETEEKVQYGTYIFAHSEPYDGLVEFMAEYDYPMDLNSNYVPENDEQAFQRGLEQLEGLGDDFEIPDDWLENGS